MNGLQFTLLRLRGYAVEVGQRKLPKMALAQSNGAFKFKR